MIFLECQLCGQVARRLTRKQKRKPRIYLRGFLTLFFYFLCEVDADVLPLADGSFDARDGHGADGLAGGAHDLTDVLRIPHSITQTDGDACRLDAADSSATHFCPFVFVMRYAIRDMHFSLSNGYSISDIQGVVNIF